MNRARPHRFKIQSLTISYVERVDSARRRYHFEEKIKRWVNQPASWSIERELPQDRSPLERIKDWNEFHEHFAEAKLQQQGARCMDCGIPFCHTGQLISGMASGCPVNNLIPGVE